MTEAAYPTQISETEIRLTSPAQTKMAELMNQADAGITAIRVFVSGGGCSGMTYGMTFTDATQPYDSMLEHDAYRIAVDPVAMSYLEGCEIDFVDDGLQSSFVFNNVFRSVGGSGGCGGCGGGGF